jgi:1-deoxy-D-xylulose-5-phosphate synthase
VLAPSSAQELQAMLHDALELCDGPVAIRYPRGPARQVLDHEVGVGLSARRARQGDDVCLIGVGKLLAAAEKAAAILAAEGIACTVWDPRCVRPLDPEMITDAARHRLVVTAEDGIQNGGVGSLIADAVTVACGGAIARVVTLGLPTEFLPHGNADHLLAGLGLDGEGIAATVRLHVG